METKNINEVDPGMMAVITFFLSLLLGAITSFVYNADLGFFAVILGSLSIFLFIVGIYFTSITLKW